MCSSYPGEGTDASSVAPTPLVTVLPRSVPSLEQRLDPNQTLLKPTPAVPQSPVAITGGVSASSKKLATG